MPHRFLLTAASAAAVALGLAQPAAAAATTDLDGRWRTAEGDGLVEFRPCGSSLCGYLVGTPSAIGPQTLLIDRLMAASGAWRGGRIIDPSSGKVYAGEVRRLDEVRLKVTGCLVRPLCGSQVWSRAR